MRHSNGALIGLLTIQTILLLIFSCKLSNSIVIVNNNDQQTKDVAAPLTLKQTPFKSNLTLHDAKELDSSSSFYYEADTYLLNKKHEIVKPSDHQASSAASSGKSSIKVGIKNEPENASASKQPAPPPAGFNSISGRSGRMLDLDALVGDLAASRANRERSQSGERQSRNLNAAQLANLDIGPGKKLHIQGYIPILGVRDATPDESAADGGGESLAMAASSAATAATGKQLLGAANKAGHEAGMWPYGQSSIGHASFNVQRYLNTEPGDGPISMGAAASSGFSNNIAANQYSNQLSTEPKYAAQSVVDHLKRPIKRLASSFGSATASGGQETFAAAQTNTQQAAPPQNCLCVPFYMCKNGFISESSLGRSQIQQMIQQQQQQQQLQMAATNQQARQIAMAVPPTQSSVSQMIDQQQQQQQTAGQLAVGQAVHKQGSVESVPSGQLSYANSYVPVDERSFEREIITAPPPPLVDQSALNTSHTPLATQEEIQSANENLKHFDEDSSRPSEALTKQQSVIDQYQAIVATTSLAGNNSSSQSDDLSANTDYSQDILGRMLGLKSSSSSSLSSAFNSKISLPQLGHHQQPGGVCGLLRTCCAIAPQTPPGATYPEQRYSSSSSSSWSKPNHVAQPQAHGVYQPVQQQTQQLQRYQQFDALQPAPMQMMASASNQALMVQQAPPTQISQGLVHRTSNQYQYQAQRPVAQQIAQYARATPSNQPLASFNQQSAAYSQQQQQQQQQQLQGQAMTMTTLTRPQQLNGQLGTRKLLEGRCGLRHSSGINGRVQNLQYHENAAEFGEYPAQAAILKRLNGSESLFVCSGTLISHAWVATAAHCIRKHMAAGEQLKVRLGEWDVHRDDEFYPFVEKEVRDLVLHPDFQAGNLINDLALLRLDTPIDSTLPHVGPACLPALDESFARQKCWVTGWGKDSFGQKGSFQAVLQEVELPVLSPPICEQALRQTRLGPHYRLHAGFLCAGGEGGRDACEGDGGSGLYCAQPDGTTKVAGLVSWGIGCGQPGVPGVYVNVAHYRPWIESIISIEEDIYSSSAAAAVNSQQLAVSNANSLAPYGMPNTLISERSNGANGTSGEAAAVAANESLLASTTTTTTSAPITTTAQTQDL